MKFENQTFEFHGNFCLETKFLDIFFLAPPAVLFEQALPEGVIAAASPRLPFALDLLTKFVR